VFDGNYGHDHYGFDFSAETATAGSYLVDDLFQSAAYGESDTMLEHARRLLPHADFRVGRLQEELPTGRFDVVMSALAVHHLDGPHKADLFVRVIRIVNPGGRFVLGDMIVPDDANDVVNPIDGEYDQPSTIAAQLQWLTDAGGAGSGAGRRR
jgi:tRNA (cmo5U34)-methyltransferase